MGQVSAGLFQVCLKLGDVALQNSGASPAVSMSYSCEAVVIRANEQRTYDPPATFQMQQYIPSVPKDTEVPINRIPIFAVAQRLFEMRQRWAARNRNSVIGEVPVLLVRGAIFYDDIFGKTFRSDFAFTFDWQPIAWPGVQDADGFVADNVGNNLSPIQAPIPTFVRIRGRNEHIQ
jgi:hypothetical protein